MRPWLSWSRVEYVASGVRRADVGGVASAWAVAAGLCLFAAFRSRPLPLGLLGVLGLVSAGVCLALGVTRAGKDGLPVFALVRPRRPAAVWILACVAVGAALGAAYRLRADLALFPSTLGWFVLPAAAIGAAEELVYRGFILTGLRGNGRRSAVILAAAGHTAYKHLVFVGRPETVTTELGFLAVVTFLVGILLGAVREGSNSLWPSLLGHAAFDIVMYGALSAAPWWVG